MFCVGYGRQVENESAPLLSQVRSMLQAMLFVIATAAVAAKSGKGGRRGSSIGSSLGLERQQFVLPSFLVCFDCGGLTTLKSPLDESAWEAWRDWAQLQPPCL